MPVGAPPQQRTFFVTPLDIATNVGTPGEATLDDQIGFMAYGLQIDNPTAQWWQVMNLDAFIPPYTLGIQLPIRQGTQVAQVRPIQPVGNDEYHSLDGQQARFIYTETSVNAPFAGVQTRVQPNEMIFTVTLCPD